MHEPSPLLHLPNHRAARWQLLAELIAHWYRPLTGRDGYSRDELEATQQRTGIRLPAALTEWYELAGRRGAVWSKQDEFLPPDRIYEYNNALVFYVENQGVVTWGIPIDSVAQDDPPVVVESVDREGQWIPQTDCLSKFALYMFAYTLMFTDHDWWIYGYAHPPLVEAIVDTFPQLEFPGNWWTRSRLFGYRDLVVNLDDAGFVHVSATSSDCPTAFTDLVTDGDFDLHDSSHDR